MKGDHVLKKWFVFSIALTFSIISVFIVFQTTRADKPLYTDVSISEYNTKIEEKESFIMYVYSTSCTACQTFKPVLNNVIDNQEVEVLGFDVNNSQNRNIPFLKEKNLKETPTLVIYEKGEEQSRKVGYLSEKELITFLDLEN